jgi:hypothetical protein
VAERLLRRIANNSKKEARYLRSVIDEMVRAERLYFTAEEEADEERWLIKFFQLADDLKNGPVPEIDHYSNILLDQRKWLNAYYTEYQLKTSLPPRQYIAWISKHSKKLHEGLRGLSCLCEYRKSFDKITEEDLYNCHGLADLTNILLAELHRSSPSSVARYLSHFKHR